MTESNSRREPAPGSSAAPLVPALDPTRDSLPADALQVLAVPAFTDNYLWLLHDAAGHTLAIDPGAAEPVVAALQQHGLRLRGIVLTHHHADHVGGVAALLARWPVPVYGPADPRVPATVVVAAGAVVEVAGTALRLQVLEVPGHTRSHLAYHGAAGLFCGDTLFALGCGRLFEGTPEQMWDSLLRLAALPGHTPVYCAHEYTEANLRFALQLFPDDPALLQHAGEIRALRGAGLPTVPTRLDRELALNPFLRMREPRWRRALAGRGVPDEALAAFAAVRRLKDDFR